MKHKLLSNIPIYHQCISCGYIEKSMAIENGNFPNCSGCGEEFSRSYIWFPDITYEYTIMIKDYYLREPSMLRKEYFNAQK